MSVQREKGPAPQGPCLLSAQLSPAQAPAPAKGQAWLSRGSWARGLPRGPAAGHPPAALAQACSLSALQSRSFTSGGRVLNRSSSTTRPLRLSRGHSPSSTGRHSSRLPRSSIWVRLVSSPTREGSDCSTLLPRCRARSFRHWKSSGGSASIRLAVTARFWRFCRRPMSAGRKVRLLWLRSR
uniref:Volume-regulated anion channel subunit LRRC8A n=1 Tax=Sus scrofa TaxID=9823 RepID=A0A480HJF4_PIG